MLSSMVNGRAITSHVLFAMSILSARFFSFALKSRTLWSTNKKTYAAASITTLRGGASSEAPINVEKVDQKFHLDALALYEKLRSCNDGYIAAPVNSALDILMDALRLYGPKQLFASYNGGKDAVVVLHLLRAATAKYSQDIGKVCKPKLIYFAIDDEFPEVVDHINDSEKMYELDLERCEVGIMKGLKLYIDKLGPESTTAFILGTRKGDPNCGDQQAFAPSSSWMPPFMRVNPILNWDYGHVWHFLRTFNLPYCVLYDQGYTSLGKRADTMPNPALLRKGVVSGPDAETPKYWPAYMLADWEMERAGRGNQTKAATSTRASSLTPLPSPREGAFYRSNSTDGENGSIITAGMVIIGDEILNGFTKEVNMHVASEKLASIGIPLKRVCIVSDNVDEIASEVRRMSQKYDLVITSGGIGPTHDDVTLKAVASALDQNIVVNKEMMAHLESIQAASSSAKPASEKGLDESMRRLALLPEHSTLLFPPVDDEHTPTDTKSDSASSSPDKKGLTAASFPKQKVWPVLQCDNIFVLPGIPQFFANKMDLITKHFVPRNKALETRRIVLDVEERNLVKTLDTLVEENSGVKFGSYPFVDHPEYKTIIVIEGSDEVLVDIAVNSLLNRLPTNAVLRVERGVSKSESIKSCKR